MERQFDLFYKTSFLKARYGIQYEIPPPPLSLSDGAAVMLSLYSEQQIRGSQGNHRIISIDRR